jgi:hypothetical protein
LTKIREALLPNPNVDARAVLPSEESMAGIGAALIGTKKFIRERIHAPPQVDAVRRGPGVRGEVVAASEDECEIYRRVKQPTSFFR